LETLLAGKDLSEEESFWAMKEILSGNVVPVQDCGIPRRLAGQGPKRSTRLRVCKSHA